MPHSRSGLRRTTSFVSVSSSRAPRLEAFATGGFSRPATLDACLALLRDDPHAKLVAGATDVGVESNLLGAPVAAPDQPGCDRRAAGVFEHTGRASSLAPRFRSTRLAGAGPTRPRRFGEWLGAVRLAADSQPRDDRRQSGYRVADRRRRAAAPRARRDRARRRTVRAPIDSAVVVLHRLPQDGDGAGRDDRHASRYRSRCRSSCASTRSRSGGSTTSAPWRRRWRSTSIRTAKCGARGLRSAAWRRRLSESPRPKPPSSISRGTTRRWSACRPILDRTLQPMSDHRGSKEYRLEVSKSLVEKFRWEHAL